MAGLKILHTIPGISIDSGGPSRSVTGLCAHLCDRNLDVALARAPGCAEEVPLDPRITAGFFNCSNRTLAFPARPDRYSPDLVHAHALWMPFCHAVTRYARQNELPLIVATRGMLQPWALHHKWFKKRLAWCLYQKRDLLAATAFHATAQSEADCIRALGFKQPIAIIPNGVELPPESGAQGNHEGVRAGDNASAVRIALFLSRLHPVKGVPMLLDAWKKLLPRGWELCIAGNGTPAERAALEMEIQKRKLSDCVTLPGPVFGEQKEHLFQQASLFILPSYTENFGIVVAEALSYGIPVITTTGTPWSALAQVDCGWWTPPTADGLAEALQQAFSYTPTKLQQMGANGRSYVQSNFTWPGIAEKFEMFYEWVLHSNLPKPDYVI